MSIAAVSWRTWEGRVVEGKFPLRQWLGGSDHSAVFLTERRDQTGQKAAIKLIAADGTEANHQLERWREAGQLSNPHLIRIFESGRSQVNGTPLLYAVMEYAEEDLSQILPQRPLTPPEVGDMLPPLLDALSYLHKKGFVHGRIRPSNVLAVGDQLKLTSDHVTSSQETISPRRQRDLFDAPETAAGIISPASDLWSVGATVVAALMQNPGIPGESSNGDPGGDPGLPQAMPEPFRSIARECLHFDPQRRCSIDSITVRLHPVARSIPAPAPNRPEPMHLSDGSRSRMPAVIGALVAAALLIGLIVFFFRGSGPPRPSAGEQSQGESAAPVAPQTPPAPAPAQPRARAAKPPATAPAPKTATRPAPAKALPPKTPASTAGAQGVATNQVLPDISKNARNTIRGHIKVNVRVEVDSTGKVTSSKLTNAGPSRYFADKALQASQKWEFTPPQIGGQPARSAWILHFRFGRARTEVSTEQLNR
jgi:TonB family protein